MKKPAILLILFTFFTFFLIDNFQAEAQKKNKKKMDKGPSIPVLKTNFQRFSLFAYIDGSYVHQETNNVWTETTLELNPKTMTVTMPGIGRPQHCTYILDSCQFINSENVMEVILIPLKCKVSVETVEARDLRIHCVHRKNKTDYLFSLGNTSSKDRILFHNYSDIELGKLIASKEIRFE